MSHDGTTLYGTFLTDEAVHDLPSRVDWFWREGVGGAPIGQVLAEAYGLQIPECPVSTSPVFYGSFYGVLSADGRVLTAQCSEFATPEPDETTYVITLPASASWAEATDGFFDDPDRWAPARVPDAATLTRLGATGADYTVTLRDDPTLPSLTVAVAPEEAAPTVFLDLDGRTLTLAPEADALDALVVGDQGDGALFLTDGTVNANGAVTVGHSGTAQGQLISEVTFQIDGPLVVGEAADNDGADPSIFSVIGGTTTAAVGFDVGLGAETDALLLVESGATLQVPSASVSTIGFAGRGELTADGGFLSHTGPLTLGRLASGTGTLNLRGGATALTTDSLVVGLEGIGKMEVEGGSGLSTGPSVLASRAGSGAAVRLAGAGSEWDVAGDLLVGLDGAAVLEVVEGASLCVSGLGLPGPQGRVVTDATVQIGVSDCTSASGTSASGTGSRARRVPGISLGALTMAAGGSVEAPAIEVGPSGVLDGAGGLAIPVTSGGTLAPGGEGAVGTLALSAPLTQTTDGVLAIEVGADAADALTVDGAMALGGTLRVMAVPDAAVTVGARYDVLTATSLTGAFDRIEAVDGLEVAVSATGVTVTVVSPVAGEDAPAGGLALEVAPNPASGPVALDIALPEAGPVRVAVYDALGREVAVPVDREMPAGEHTIRLGGGLAPGVYVVRLGAGAGAASQMLTVVR
ncbi:MAG: T9SS type A sorting domain-containing protein [Bacteroidota bacterium]